MFNLHICYLNRQTTAVTGPKYWNTTEIPVKNAGLPVKDTEDTNTGFKSEILCQHRKLL